MTTHWIGVAAERHVRGGAEAGFVMFGHGDHRAVERTKPGDLFAYYAMRETLDAKSEPVRKFTALGRIAEGEPFENKVMAGRIGWARHATYAPCEPADIYPLLDRFSFIRDRRHWGMAFRRSLFSVTPADFALIAEAMGVPKTFLN